MNNCSNFVLFIILSYISFVMGFTNLASIKRNINRPNNVGKALKIVQIKIVEAVVIIMSHICPTLYYTTNVVSKMGPV